MGVDYKYYEFQAYAYLVRLQQLFRGFSDLPEVRRQQGIIEQEQERIKTRHFRVAVVGEFRKGKSSFINALLGKEILPVDALPTTATINRITYGSTPRAYLKYKDGHKKEIPVGQLAEYVTKLTGKSQNEAAKIEEAVVEYPSISCQNYVDLIDTPGMNDDVEMNSLTLGQLEKIDLAIVAISATHPFSDTESCFVTRLLESKEVCQIVVVVTKIDLIREGDRSKLLDFLRKRIPDKVQEKLRETYPAEDPIFLKYRRIFSQLPLFGVCALDALEARQYSNEKLFERSGFAELTEKLPFLILTSQNNNTVYKAMDTIDQLTGDFLEIRQQAMEHLGEYQENLKELREKFAYMAYTGVQNMLDEIRVKVFAKINNFKEIQHEIRKDFIRSLSSVRVLEVEMIGQALQEQACESAAKINGKVCQELLPSLEQLCCQESEKNFRELTTQLKEFLSEQPDGKKEFKKFINKIQNLHLQNNLPVNWQEKEFTWKVSPVPANSHLLDMDLIDQVLGGVEESLEVYCGNKKQEMVRHMDNIGRRAGDILEQVVVELFEYSGEKICRWEEMEQRISSEKTKENLRLLMKENLELRRQFMKEFFDNEQG